MTSTRAKFHRLCKLMREVTAEGYYLRVTDEGAVHLLREPPNMWLRASARRERVVATEQVPGASGGPW